MTHCLSLSTRQANSMHTLHIMITQRSNCIVQNNDLDYSGEISFTIGGIIYKI